MHELAVRFFQSRRDELFNDLYNSRRAMEAEIEERAETVRKTIPNSDNAAIEQCCHEFVHESRELRRAFNRRANELERKLAEEQERGRMNEQALRQLESKIQKERENVMKFVLALENKVRQGR
jgi:vacuolar-type H+-ATPase subunit I/STV1